VGVIPAGHVIQAFEWTGCGIHRRSVDSTHSKALTILQKYFQNRQPTEAAGACLRP
jgi:hypothetical protein